MAIVKLIDGRVFENARLTDVKHVGEEGSRSATAHIDGKTYHVFNSIIDGFDPVWNEQMSWETYQLLKGAVTTDFVEGSATSLDHDEAE